MSGVERIWKPEELSNGKEELRFRRNGLQPTEGGWVIWKPQWNEIRGWRPLNGNAQGVGRHTPASEYDCKVILEMGLDKYLKN